MFGNFINALRLHLKIFRSYKFIESLIYFLLNKMILYQLILKYVI